MTRAPRGALPFILVTVLLGAVGFGIIIPVLPKLLSELSGEGLDRAAVYGGWLMFAYALMQFFFAPVLGSLGDRYGRRPVLLLALAVLAADFLVMALAPTLGWLFAARIASGIAGATGTTASAYVADITAAADRARSFGRIGAAWGVGFVLGPVAGGLLGEIGWRAPFYAAAGLAFVNLAYGALVLPESLPRARRRAFSLARANPAGALIALRRDGPLLAFLAVVLLYQIAHDTNPAVWTYYTMYRFGWGEAIVGLSLGLVGLSSALVQGFAVGPVVRRLGEPRTVILGLTVMALCFVGIALAPAGWMVLVLVVPYCAGGVAMPALRGIRANRAADDAQGELQGAVTSTISLAAILAPLAMTRTFERFSGADAAVHLPGAPFLLAALLILLGLGAFAVILARA